MTADIVTSDWAAGAHTSAPGHRSGPIHITGSAAHGEHFHMMSTTVPDHGEVGKALMAMHKNIKEGELPEHHMHIHHEDTGMVHHVKLNNKGYHSSSYSPGHYGEHHPPPAAMDKAILRKGSWVRG
jgi:hypothetical protein